MDSSLNKLKELKDIAEESKGDISIYFNRYSGWVVRFWHKLISVDDEFPSYYSNDDDSCGSLEDAIESVLKKVRE